jgi:hypothetical protein
VDGGASPTVGDALNQGRPPGPVGHPATPLPLPLVSDHNRSNFLCIPLDHPSRPRSLNLSLWLPVQHDSTTARQHDSSIFDRGRELPRGACSTTFAIGLSSAPNATTPLLERDNTTFAVISKCLLFPKEGVVDG